MTAKTDSRKNNDTMLKVIALICALLLWFYAEAQENPSKERQLAIPVRYINLATDYVVENASQTVQIVVKGNETDIMSLRGDDFVAEVDLTNASIGSAVYPVLVTGAGVNERFTVTPDKLTVSVDKIQQKEVPIQLRTDGNPAQYYELYQTDTMPNTVTIRGRSKVLADISDVETEAVNVSDIQTDMEQTVSLVLPEGVTVQNENGSFVEQLQVLAALYVHPIQGERMLETSIAIRNIAEGLNAEAEPLRASMRLQGDAALLETQPILDQLLLYVDCSGLTAGTHVLPISVEASNEDVHNALQTVSPQTVTVILYAEGTELPSDEEINTENEIN